MVGPFFVRCAQGSTNSAPRGRTRMRRSAVATGPPGSGVVRRDVNDLDGRGADDTRAGPMVFFVGRGAAAQPTGGDEQDRD